MKNYRFEAVYGEVRKQVEILEASTGGQYFHIYIDRYFFGALAHVRGEWVHLAVKPYFTIDDIQVLVELVEEHLL